MTSCFAISEYRRMKQAIYIEWSVRSIKDLSRLSPGNRELVIAKIEQRVDHYRVIFRIERGAVTILLIMRARHGREAYD